MGDLPLQTVDGLKGKFAERAEDDVGWAEFGRVGRKAG